MDKSREQFEAWVRIETGMNLYRTKYALTAEKDQQYIDHDINLAWMAWQASRSEIELDIDWPEANDDYWKDGEEGAYARGYEDGKDLTSIRVRQALVAAGLKDKTLSETLGSLKKLIDRQGGYKHEALKQEQSDE
ncbi:hypothetical protein ACOJD9_003120 [Cronobacter dublinensis]